MRHWNIFTVWVLVLVSHFTAEAVEEVLLRGAGASFPRAVYERWIPEYQAYRRDHVRIRMKYDVTGSGTGKKRIKGEIGPVVEYAGSDSLLYEEDYINHPHIQMFPAMAG